MIANVKEIKKKKKIADTIFRNRVIVCLELYLYSRHTNFWVNQEKIIKQVHDCKIF